jgi:alpha-galactosidase
MLRRQALGPSARSMLILGSVASLFLALGSLGRLASSIPPAVALENGLARTPPMGWNSWYGFGCNVNQQTIRQVADALGSSGLQAAGYSYVNLDDCWAEGRKSDGTIVPDATRFPDGIAALADYVHTRGLKFGLYTDAGATTCGGRPGSLNHEQQDATTYASWGVDFVKVDWCDNQGLDAATQYAKLRDALAIAGAAYQHPILFSIADEGLSDPWVWGPATGNMWRTSDDIGIATNRWQYMLGALDENARHADAAGPGGWNDPDALQVGLGERFGPGGMTPLEERAHFSMWAIMAAPLIVSIDPRTMSEYTKQTLTNADAIAIDQDPAGIQGRLVKQDATGLLQVWSKPLQATGSRAVALFNRGREPATIAVAWREIGLSGHRATVKDVWAGTPPEVYTDRFSVTVPGHAVTLLIITTVS